MSAEQRPTNPPARKRILIVDDHPIMRQGLAQLINHEPGYAACCQAASAREAFKAATERSPDLVLLDLNLPDKSGLDLIKDLHAVKPELPVLVISMHEEMVYAERVLRAGGRGYIMKQEGGEKLLEAIREVLAGKIYVSKQMSSRILEVFSGNRDKKAASAIETLTDREFEVFQLIGQGQTTKEIAAHLSVSPKTIEVHRVNIKQKLGVQTAAELIRSAVRWVETQKG